MTMAPGLRKLVLTTHISSSVGWFGAIVAFLALSVTGLTRQDPQLVHAADLGMSWIGWFVLVPLSVASLLTGLIQSLGTEWGLFRHYWVLAKLLMNVFANIVLLLFMQQLGSAAYRGSDAPPIHAAVALLLLLVATILSVYKPRGITPYGWRKQRQRRVAASRRWQAARDASGVAAADAAPSAPARSREPIQRGLR
jgi:hypothetical protein